MTAEQLRKSILQWAIQGKLTKQNPDESAIDLLNEIKLEKQKLIEENKIKKDDLTNSFIYKNTSDNCYYEKFEEINNKSKDNQKTSIKIMSLWQVVYFDKRFKGVEKHKQSKVLKYKHISSQELNSIKMDNNGKVRLLSTGKLDGFCNIELDDNRVNFGKVITIPTGGSAIIKYHSGYFIDSLNILMESQDSNLYDSKYIYYCLLEQSDLIQQYFKGSSIQHPDMKKIVEISLLIPNIEIQKNIVKTIELLEPFITKYSELFSELELLRNEFPKKLQKSILNYAMQGKLISNGIDNDLAVEELLDNIKKEQLKLKQLSKDKLKLSIIYKNASDNSYYEKFEDGIEEKMEVPFEIPDSWIWARLGIISNIKGGFAFKSSKFSDKGVRIIRISDFNENNMIDNDIKRYPISIELNKYKIYDKSILMAMTGGTVGKTILFKSMQEDCYLNQRVCMIKPMYINELFINYSLKSSYIKNYINKIKTSTNDNISLENIKKFLIPLPPVKEQKQIVDKINEINDLINSVWH
ncbi:Type I restriction modification system specificity (S) subunit, HsdS [Mycoplasmopsis bovis 8790]|nr:Type I restriction modification system specificity (S) subunit, HsdS [Mycoplasmopsis bovis 8790]